MSIFQASPEGGLRREIRRKSVDLIICEPGTDTPHIAGQLEQSPVGGQLGKLAASVTRHAILSRLSCENWQRTGRQWVEQALYYKNDGQEMGVPDSLISRYERVHLEPVPFS